MTNHDKPEDGAFVTAMVLFFVLAGTAWWLGYTIPLPKEYVPPDNFERIEIQQ